MATTAPLPLRLGRDGHALRPPPARRRALERRAANSHCHSIPARPGSSAIDRLEWESFIIDSCVANAHGRPAKGRRMDKLRELARSLAAQGSIVPVAEGWVPCPRLSWACRECEKTTAWPRQA